LGFCDVFTILRGWRADHQKVRFGYLLFRSQMLPYLRGSGLWRCSFGATFAVNVGWSILFNSLGELACEIGIAVAGLKPHHVAAGEFNVLNFAHVAVGAVLP
jgi:hypothetical protein